MQLSVPTLILHSKDDQVWRFSKAEELHSLVPGSRLAITTRGYHYQLLATVGWTSLPLPLVRQPKITRTHRADERGVVRRRSVVSRGGWRTLG